MSSIVLSGDTSGTVTVAAPAVAGTNTATLPAATGTVMVSGNMPAFSAYNNTSQTLSGSTYTKITCNVKEFDTNSYYDNTTNYRFTPLVAGYYQFTAGIGIATTQTEILVTFYKNGSQFKQVQNTGNASTSATSGSALIYCNGSTDYVELYGLISTGQNLAPQSYLTYFQAAMVRSA
jgi:hypothetical protein